MTQVSSRVVAVTDLHRARVRSAALPDAAPPSARLALMAALAAALAGGLWMTTPPEPVGAEVAASSFSSARAMTHVRSLAATSRPVGSPAHDEAVGYLADVISRLGVPVEAQRTFTADRAGVGGLRGMHVANVVARLEGMRPGHSVLLVAHYDSVPTSRGAADNAAAVGVLLETLRALVAGPRLRNDVVVLFTDGEEVGLMGAQAFVDQHPLAKSVGMVLNFDARGNTGPVLTFETGRPNATAIAGLAAADTHARASAVFADLYRLLPNDTDFSPFRRAGLPGLNFAATDGSARYHSLLDTADALDERTVQHQGRHALALARHFGEQDLTAPASAELAYFNVGSYLVHYPQAWNPIVMAAATAASLLVCAWGVRTRRLRLRALAQGLAVVPLTAALVLIGLTAAVAALQVVDPAMPYHPAPYMIAFALLTLAILLAIDRLTCPRVRAADVTIASLVWILIAGWASVAGAPGGVYLWAAAAIVGTLGSLAHMLPVLGGSRARQWCVLATAGAAFVLVVGPDIVIVFKGLTVAASSVVMTAAVVLGAAVFPHVRLIAGTRVWAVIGIAMLAGLALVGAGVAQRGPSVQQPNANHLFYVLEPNRARAVWTSIDRRVDAWTAPYLEHQAPPSRVTTLLQAQSPRATLVQGIAPIVPLDGATATVVDDLMIEGRRRLRLRITSPRGAASVSLVFDAEIERAEVDGRELPAPEDWRRSGSPTPYWFFQYWAPPRDGFDLTVITSTLRPSLTMMDHTDGFRGLPVELVPARPEAMVPRRALFSDAVIVASSFTF